MNRASILWILCRLYVAQAQTEQSSNLQSEPIISGSRAALGQFPWQVILKRNQQDELFCGGSIISNKWVLTAGHCVDNKTSIILAFGTIDLKNYDVNMTSTQFYLHPDYDSANLINDIALIELPTSLNFTTNIQAIDLVSTAQASNSFVGAEGIITGFGKTSDVEVSDVLLWGTVEILNNTICAVAYHEERTEDTVICGFSYNNINISPCDGDSGGALVWRNESNTFIQIGIISYSFKNICSQYPTGYTRVSSYLDYIQNITGLNFDLIK